MKTTNNTNTNSTPATVPFTALVAAFESAYIHGNGAKDTTDALMPLATAIAHSVLNKVIDPQRKAAVERDTVSDSGLNPALVSLKRELTADTARLAKFENAAAVAIGAGFTADGDYKPVTHNADLVPSLDLIDGTTTGDGIDLVNAAAVALLEMAEKYSEMGVGFMTAPVTVRRLSKKVVIQSAKSAHFKDDDTTPIQEVYKAVRREIANSRAMQTDPRNGYTYLEDMVKDTETNALEVVYVRQGKFADLGGHDSNGLYSADRQTADDTAALIERLNLNSRQAAVLALRLRGYGNKAIGTYLGVDPANIKRTLKQIQTKCVEIGLAPATTDSTNGNG